MVLATICTELMYGGDVVTRALADEAMDIALALDDDVDVVLVGLRLLAGLHAPIWQRRFEAVLADVVARADRTADPVLL